MSSTRIDLGWTDNSTNDSFNDNSTDNSTDNSIAAAAMLNPDVVATEPRLDDGTPFPTTFYLTCPRAASLIASGRSATAIHGLPNRLAAASTSGA